MKKKFLLVPALVTTMLMSSLSINAFAADNIPVIDDSEDFSNVGKPTYLYENGFVIESHEVTAEEIKLGQDLLKLHIHPQGVGRHFSLTPHFHTIRDIKTASPRTFVWVPTQVWTRNSQYPNSSDWPTVSWTNSQTLNVSKSVSTSVGVTDSVVSASLGESYTKGTSITTSTTRSFKVPYKKEGRVKVTYSRPCKTFTCATKYVVTGPPLVEWEDTGSGSALGYPTNIVCDIETRNY